MKIYAADHIAGDVVYDITYPAESIADAQNIAQANGWRYLGEIIHSQECSDELTAMYERAIFDLTVH